MMSVQHTEQEGLVCVGNSQATWIIMIKILLAAGRCISGVKLTKA